jgi:hypothetical protein
MPPKPNTDVDAVEGTNRSSSVSNSGFIDVLPEKAPGVTYGIRVTYGIQGRLYPSLLAIQLLTGSSRREWSESGKSLG